MLEGLSWIVPALVGYNLMMLAIVLTKYLFKGGK